MRPGDYTNLSADQQDRLKDIEDSYRGGGSRRPGGGADLSSADKNRAKEEFLRQESSNYARNRAMEMAQDKTFREEAKKDGRWNKGIEKLAKIGGNGGITSLKDLALVDRAMNKYGKKSGVHNGQNMGDNDMHDSAMHMSKHYYGMFSRADEAKKKKKDPTEAAVENDPDNQAKYDAIEDRVQAEEDRRTAAGERLDKYGDMDGYEQAAKDGTYNKSKGQEAAMKFANDFKKTLITGKYDRDKEQKASRFDVQD